MDVTITFDAAASLEDGTEVTVTTGADGGATSGLTVPLLAIRDDADGTYVTTVGSDGTQTRAPVTVGETVDGYALITGDAVHDGDTVVVSSR
jgi:multidrug efflux pump subunit AcrA (membrane-fusion protein)